MALELIKKARIKIPLEGISIRISKQQIIFSKQVIDLLSFVEDGINRRYFVEIYFDKENKLLALKPTKDAIVGYTFHHTYIQSSSRIKSLGLKEGIYYGKSDKDNKIIFKLK